MAFLQGKWIDFDLACVVACLSLSFAGLKSSRPEWVMAHLRAGQVCACACASTIGQIALPLPALRAG